MKYSMQIASLLLLLLTCECSKAQVMGNSQHARATGNSLYNEPTPYGSQQRTEAFPDIINNQIDLQVSGLVNVVPDCFVANFNLVQVGETAQQTQQLISTKINQLKEKLAASGIPPTNISIDMISFVPKFDLEVENRLFSKSYNEIPSGFELQKNISIRYTKSAQLDELVALCAELEIYDLVKVDYFLTNPQPIRDELREKCWLEIRSRMKSYQNAGVKMDTLRAVAGEKFNTVYPGKRYSAYQAFSRPSLNSAKKRSSQTINETYKAISRYYDPLDPSKFDVIINPVILEPVVQITYHLSVRFVYETDNRHFIITPSGDLKPIPLH